MDSVLKRFIGMYFMAFLCVIGIAFLHSQLEARLAEEFLLESVLSIEEAYYDPDVIGDCKKLAADKGYALEVDVKEDENGYFRGRVELVYGFTVPFTNIKLDKKLMEYII